MIFPSILLGTDGYSQKIGLFTEISVMNMDYAWLAIAQASRMLDLLGKEEVEPLEREGWNWSQFKQQ